MEKALEDMWQERLDRVTHEVVQICDQHDPAALHVSPHPGAWTAAEVLEHIMAVNTSYFPLFDMLVSGTFRPPLMAKLPVLPGMFGRMILQSVHPANKRKTKTLPMWRPGKNVEISAIAKRFSDHQEELRGYLPRLSPLIDQHVIIHSPASNRIVYSLEHAIEIIVTHEERHLEQFKRAAGGM